ncbi:MAG: glycosyl transferase family 2, partial [Labilithrix sp.]|nr:glycosyl transferase family 2 [Labilithrix sp.]
DHGVYDALNLGVVLSSGRYVMILGAGDRLRAGALVSLLQSAPLSRFGMIYGDVFMEDLACRYGGEWTLERFRKQNLCQQGILYSRDIFRLLGGFDLKYPILSDYDFNIRCFGNRKIKRVYVPEIVADYLGGGLSATTPDEAFMQDRPWLVHEHLGLPLKLKKPANIPDKKGLVPVSFSERILGRRSLTRSSWLH